MDLIYPNSLIWLVQDNAISNTRVRLLNELIGANVGSDVLFVKSVDTAVPEDTTDSVRFILSGTLAGSFGVVSQYFRNALGSASLNGTSVFNTSTNHLMSLH